MLPCTTLVSGKVLKPQGNINTEFKGFTSPCFVVIVYTACNDLAKTSRARDEDV